MENQQSINFHMANVAVTSLQQKVFFFFFLMCSSGDSMQRLKELGFSGYQ